MAAMMREHAMLRLSWRPHEADGSHIMYVDAVGVYYAKSSVS